MATPTTTSLRRPAYASLLKALVGMPADEIRVEVHMGKQAWRRARERRWWADTGVALVVQLDAEVTVEDFDFTCFDRLQPILDARDSSYEPARSCARRMCEHGADVVLLIHPSSCSADGFHGWELFRGAPR